MIKEGNAPPRSQLIAETAAGAVRLVSLRLNHKEITAARQNEAYQRSVAAFLETEVKPPFFCHQISATAFAFNSKSDSDRFDAFIDNIYDKLTTFLFGTERAHDAEILVFAGTDTEVAEFLSEPIHEARKRSRNYLFEASNRKRKPGVIEEPLQHIPGKRPLMFRGILVCPKNVLLAYAITPASNASLNDPGMEMTDTDLGRYLRFRGAEAVEFSNRIYDKASYLLQTATQDMNSIILLVPICYNSLLSSHDRDAFYANMERHPEWIRKQLILSIFNTPLQPSTSIVQRFMSEFAHYFQNIDWHVTSPDIRPDIFTGCHLHSVTFDMHHIAGGQRERALETFSRQIPQLKALKIRAAVSGVDTREELNTCIRAGVIYASGDAVTAALKSCGPAQTVALEDLPILEPTIIDDTVGSAA